MSGTELAEKVGISRGYLSRVENGRQVPSIVLLDQIGQLFAVELDYFFSSSSDGHVAVQRNAAGAAGDIPPRATFAYEALCRERSHKLAQPFMAVFRPHSRTRVAVHEAQYFRYVIEGRLALKYRGERFDLTPGDAIYYDASVPQEIECTSDTPCRVLTLYIKSPAISSGRSPPETPEGHF